MVSSEQGLTHRARAQVPDIQPSGHPKNEKTGAKAGQY
jgi:hypothetical protein